MLPEVCDSLLLPRLQSLKVTFRRENDNDSIISTGAFSRGKDDIKIPRKVFSVAGERPRSSSKSSTRLEPIFLSYDILHGRATYIPQ